MGMVFLYPRKSHLISAPITFASSGNNTLIALSATKRIMVHRLWLVVAGATALTFKNGSTELSGAVPMLSNGGMTFDITGEPWFEVDIGNAFILNSSNAVQVSGSVYYALT